MTLPTAGNVKQAHLAWVSHPYQHAEYTVLCVARIK
jgi:hypothetical protein